MNSLTGVVSVSGAFLHQDQIATLVSAFDCDAISKIVSVAIFREIPCRSSRPRSSIGRPSRSTTHAPGMRLSATY